MKFVCFLRGINVGGRIIKMVELKACFESMGFTDVTTILQSGNVMFDFNGPIDSLKPTIEAGLTARFEYPAKVWCSSIDRLEEIIDDCPFTEADPEFHRYVLFFEPGLVSRLKDKATQLDKEEEIRLGDEVLYWRVSKGQTLKSTFAHYLAKAPYKTGNTNRNLNTLQKIVLIGRAS